MAVSFILEFLTDNDTQLEEEKFLSTRFYTEHTTLFITELLKPQNRIKLKQWTLD